MVFKIDWNILNPKLMINKGKLNVKKVFLPQKFHNIIHSNQSQQIGIK